MTYDVAQWYFRSNTGYLGQIPGILDQIPGILDQKFEEVKQSGSERTLTTRLTVTFKKGRKERTITSTTALTCKKSEEDKH